MYDICIIGGGPAGISAAIAAIKQNQRISVCMIEKNHTLGKKIYATGNGKCNLSNISCKDSIEVLKFFDNVGIFTRVDDAGRMYPASEQASDVVDALSNILTATNIDIKYNATPISLSTDPEGFQIRLPQETICCKKLLISTGGKAGPQYGNLGEGYTYAKQMGHHINRTYPVLAPLECEGDFQTLKGIRAKGTASLLHKGDVVATEYGEIQFAEDGLSGICIFNLSRFVRLDPGIAPVEAMKSYAVSIDFIPHMGQQEVVSLLKKRTENSEARFENLLLTVVHPGIAADILKKAGFHPGEKLIGLSQKQLQAIAMLMKQWECNVTGVKGWKKAQCTGGGIPLSEINPNSGESKLVKGLYFAGEILDYDGPSGGFNLHFAWDSGIKAGKAMADETI